MVSSPGMRRSCITHFPRTMTEEMTSLEAAYTRLAMTGPGDTVLFENDLPDNYTEN